ncbi:fungal-specific transcription factor domain-containing protein [Aspergillus californicus]
MATTRSRKGCIDCKHAKVKCDEVHPSCGTCTRRRLVCSGYAPCQSRSRAQVRGRGSVFSASPTTANPSSTANRRTSMASGTSTSTSTSTSTRSLWTYSGDRDGDSCMADYIRLIILEASTKTLSPAPGLGPTPMPLAEIMAADKPLIEVYFMRHPSEMIISSDFFVREMNGAVISLLQQSPTAVGDALAAIGENYVSDWGDTALVQVSRRTRLLGRLRRINEEESSPELVLMLLLALCGVELVDPRSDGTAATLSALIDNVAMVLAFHTRQGKTPSPMAKYFARGVARQDLLISLSRMQRTRIDPALWLDEYSMCHADRLMGLTTTLAPILSELAGLAEDVRMGRGSSVHGVAMADGDFEGRIQVPVPVRRSDGDGDLAERATSIHARLASWRPIRDPSMSLHISKMFLLHAYTWRAAGLLYLFRLFNRAGSSREADTEALSMAYEVMVHIAGSPQDIKLSLWPLFIAACELESAEDRAHAVGLFDGICYARPIVTARRTMAFVMDYIWPGRDSGGEWDWMVLARCVPVPL